METLNLDLLPEEAKKDIINYYQKLLIEVENKDDKKPWIFNRDELHEERFDNSKLGKKLKLIAYFDKFKLKPVKFNRDEANAR